MHGFQSGQLSHTWAVPPPDLSLRSDEVHAWRIPLDAPDVEVAAIHRTLSPDEAARAARFYFTQDRVRFTVARGAVRTILAGYLKLAPAELHFAYNAHGKPELSGAAGNTGLRFNVSHSRELALCVVADGRDVGIDLEYIRDDLAYDQIAERFFSPREFIALRTLSPDQRMTGFFTCWTRKEAYIKARGVGLALSLDQFDVSIVPNETDCLLAVRDAPDEVTRWSLQSLDVGSNYAAAVASEGPAYHLKRWQWSLDFGMRHHS